MLVIGVTGQTGAGKGTVCKMLEKYGLYHIDADKVAHSVYKKGSDVLSALSEAFGEDILNLLHELNQIKPVWIELGLQTIHDKTLHAIRSGFTLSQFEQAVSDLHKRNIPVITHLILGLPGETKEDMLSSVRYVGSLPVTGIKLQLLHILKGTDLGTAYMADPFPLFTLEEYCDLIADCIALLPPEIVIHRLTGDGPRNLLLAPLWSTDKKRVLNTIQKCLRERDLWQGKNI